MKVDKVPPQRLVRAAAALRVAVSVRRLAGDDTQARIPQHRIADEGTQLHFVSYELGVVDDEHATTKCSAHGLGELGQGRLMRADQTDHDVGEAGPSDRD